MAKIVTDYLDEAARKFPEKIAFVDEKRQITYSELRNEALAVACAIHKSLTSLRQNDYDSSDVSPKQIGGGTAQVPVAVYLDDGIESIVSCLGVLYSGNFFCILSTDLPQAAFDKIINVLEPRVIISDEAHAAIITPHAELILYEGIRNSSDDGMEYKNIRPSNISSDICCIINTSGTTGNPKGVIISHGSITSSIISVLESESFNRRNSNESIFYNQFPFASAGGVTKIFLAIISGSTMVSLRYIEISRMQMILETIRRFRCNILFFPTAFIELLNSAGRLDDKALQTADILWISGKEANANILNDIKYMYPNLRIINVYGTTETSGGCLHYQYETMPTEGKENTHTPIGKALSAAETIVVNDSGHKVDEHTDEIGELYIRGSVLASGYYKNIDETKKKFVQNPLHNDYEEIVYRTGDLVKYNDRGELVYIGRKDHQIQHHGHRLELEDVENRILSVVGNVECACIYDTNTEQIVFFYSGDIDEMNLYKAAHNILPKYMLPQKVVRMDNLPHNANGKVDRTKLKSEMHLLERK